MIQHSLLDDPVLSVVRRPNGDRTAMTLPEVFAALVRDEIEDFPALRPHQRHVWHALLTQLAAIWMHRAGTATLPDDPDGWRAALLSLTPDDPDGAAWALVAPLKRPAFLQPPVPEGTLTGFKPIRTPADLDMLVASKNHDLKRHAMASARPEHWTYALVSLQTQDGYLGNGKYGVSRMNGGFASRPGVGIAPPSGPGRRVVRDAARLIALRESLLEEYRMYPSADGRALLWLIPWTGNDALSPRALDIFYVEVCRRVRLADVEGRRLTAYGTPTARPRVDAKVLKGNTGDPWTPLVADGDGYKALTIDRDSFGYKRLVPLLLGRGRAASRRAPLQVVAPSDDATGLRFVARGVVRGRGETDGWLERVIPVSRSLRTLLIERPTDSGAATAMARVDDAGAFASKVLYPAVLQVYTGAPRDGERSRDDNAARQRTKRVLAAFDRLVDRTFFEDLTAELDASDDEAAARAVRASWLRGLRTIGLALLSGALAAAPAAAMRTYRVRARARDVFEAAFRRQFGDRARFASPPASATMHFDSGPPTPTAP